MSFYFKSANGSDTYISEVVAVTGNVYRDNGYQIGPLSGFEYYKMSHSEQWRTDGTSGQAGAATTGNNYRNTVGDDYLRNPDYGNSPALASYEVFTIPGLQPVTRSYPDWCTYVRVLMIGGGGSGSNGNYQYNLSGAGGGAGELTIVGFTRGTDDFGYLTYVGFGGDATLTGNGYDGEDSFFYRKNASGVTIQTWTARGGKGGEASYFPPGDPSPATGQGGAGGGNGSGLETTSTTEYSYDAGNDGESATYGFDNNSSAPNQYSGGTGTINNKDLYYGFTVGRPFNSALIHEISNQNISGNVRYAGGGGRGKGLASAQATSGVQGVVAVFYFSHKPGTISR